jgi:hypothetical protein
MKAKLFDEGTGTLRNEFYLAATIAVSWAWGFSLLTGMTVTQEKGIIPFAIWGTCNAFALAFFGWFAFKMPKLFSVQDSKFVLGFTTLVRVFSIWIQMSAIYETMVKTGFSDVTSQIGAYATGAIIIYYMFMRGIRGSMLLDQIQWYSILLCLAAIIGIGSYQGSYQFAELSWGTDKTILWSMWTGFLLLGGPIVDLQNIQRGKIAYKYNMKRAYFIAAMMFWVYMALVFVMASFEMNLIMSMLLLLAVFNLATSTINSDAVALHEIKGSRVGVIAGLSAVALWQFVKFIGFFNLWQIIANMRIWVAIGVVVFTILAMRKAKQQGETEEEVVSVVFEESHDKGIYDLKR